MGLGVWVGVCVCVENLARVTIDFFVRILMSVIMRSVTFLHIWILETGHRVCHRLAHKRFLVCWSRML